MSVWPESSSAAPALCGAEGELVSIRISIEPRLLEQLLEALARLDFPINPQLYHDATAVHVYPDGSRVTQPATVVEFPAWAGRLAQVRDALRRSGFEGAALAVRGMLDDIHSEVGQEAAPPGKPHKTIVHYKQAGRASA